jgi:hypothetical protein
MASVMLNTINRYHSRPPSFFHRALSLKLNCERKTLHGQVQHLADFLAVPVRPISVWVASYLGAAILDMAWRAELPCQATGLRCEYKVHIWGEGVPEGRKGALLHPHPSRVHQPPARHIQVLVFITFM